MASFIKTPSGTWKAVIRKEGYPLKTKTFRVKRDAQDWARRTEDEMVRSIYIERGPAERLTVEKALQRYLVEVTPTKRATTQKNEKKRADILIDCLGKYSLVALTPEIIAQHRDKRLAGDCSDKGIRVPRSNNTVRLELALLGHMYTIAIKEWRIGLPYNPVLNIRRPAPGPGRNRRLSLDEEKRLMDAVKAYSNPMLKWIVEIALETGMRSSEIATLYKSQVDVERRIVRLIETKNTTSRTVPLTIRATELFCEALVHPIRPKDVELIFYGEPGRDKKRRPYQFNSIWTKIKKELGLENFHFHDLRHEAVSRFVEAGLSDQQVAAISGHKSMQMLRRYTHLRAEDLVGVLDAVNAVKKSENGDKSESAVEVQLTNQ